MNIPQASSWRHGLLGALVAAAALLAPAWARANADEDAIKITDAQRDGAGVVWGIDGTGHDLYRLDANLRWRLATPPGIPSNMRPFCLGRRRTDGAVFCLWQTNDTNCQTSLHLGKQSKVFEPFYLTEQAQTRPTRLTGDSKGNLWVTRNSPVIYHLEDDGDAQSVRTVTSSECLPNTAIGYAAYDPWEPVYMTEDGGGRLWFWTAHPSGTTTFGGVIRGALVDDPTDFVRSDPFVQRDLLEPTLQYQKGLTVLAPKDAHHLWFGLNGDGLYTLDTDSNQIERVPGQPRDSYYTSLVVRSAAGDWLFVMSDGRALWRLTADGQWHEIIDALHGGYGGHGQQDQMWAQDEQGDYLGTNGAGVWFVPRDGARPRLLGWEQGFPLAAPRRFVPLYGGQWLGIDADGHTWIGSPAALAAAPPPPAKIKVQTMAVADAFRVDARGHLWTTVNDHPEDLSEWDGDRWIVHPLPEELGVHPPISTFNLDGRGRSWLNFWSEGRQTAIYDPVSDQWEVYANFHEALEAQNGGRDAELAVVPKGNCCQLTRFGPAGQICYMGGAFQVNYFDGRQWKTWDQEGIAGRMSAGYGGPPFFNRTGHVSINIGRRTMEYVDATWRETAPEQGFADWSGLALGANRLSAPDFDLPFQPEHAALDNQGSWWLLHDRQLYKARDGLCLPVFASAEPQPFADGRSLGWAFVDPKGHAFLRSDNNAEVVLRGPVVTLASAGPPPRTTLARDDATRHSISDELPDRVVVRLTTTARPAAGRTRFSWRLDGATWTPLASDGPAAAVTFDNLPNGPHRVEARSFDPLLQTDAAPAALDFEVRVDPAAQITRFIAELNDQDYAKREAAVAALILQPDLALPALQRARDRTDENERWWIDAAMQQVTRRRKELSR